MNPVCARLITSSTPRTTASPSTTIIRIPTAVRMSRSNVTVVSSGCPSSACSVRAGQLRLDGVGLLLDGEGAVRLRLAQVLGLEAEGVLDLVGPDRPVHVRALQRVDDLRAVGAGLLHRGGEGLDLDVGDVGVDVRGAVQAGRL